MAEARIGISGTGFIATHLVLAIAKADGYTTSRSLTRRPVDQVGGFPEGVVTNSIDDLVSNCDVVVECSGDPIWATEVVAAAIDASRPVVTMNTEFHISSGSAFVGKGVVTEAEGDQPGCLAALHEDVVAMGFHPVVYGNMKGFLNLDPTPEDMEFWAARQGISLPMVTSFTDGTKVQAEQILVANHFNATIAQEGMLAVSVDDLDQGVEALVAGYEATGRPISDYIVSGGLPHGVFLVATHEEEQAAALEYYKMGPGPYYTIIKNNIFVHLEILKTVDRVLESGRVLLDNSATPELSLGAIAKRDLAPGDRIDKAIGSFEMRGLAIRNEDRPDHVPMGLIQDGTIVEPIEAGEIIVSSKIELPDSLAVSLWQQGVTT
jgi:predicted homoserine dehydrogenase-like protein